MAKERLEDISKEEWALIEEHRKGETGKITVNVNEEPKTFEVEDMSNLVTEIEDKEEDYYTCDNCGFDKITKVMKNCPQCKAELKW